MINGCSSCGGLPVKDTIQSRELKIGEQEIHYLQAGNGKPVILLHGAASDCWDWVETMATLLPSYSLYAPDMIGFGASSRDDSGYYLSDFAEFTRQFIQTLSLNSCVLVGHSLGGRVCLEIAVRHPEVVRRLVLVDTAGFGKLARWGKFLGTTMWAVRNILKRPQPYPRFLWQDGEDRDWMCLEKLPDLKIPTLIVWNRHDPYYSLDEALLAGELIPESHLEVFPGYGHAPHMKENSHFNSLLLSFMGQQ